MVRTSGIAALLLFATALGGAAPPASDICDVDDPPLICIPGSMVSEAAPDASPAIEMTTEAAKEVAPAAMAAAERNPAQSAAQRSAKAFDEIFERIRNEPAYRPPPLENPYPVDRFGILIPPSSRDSYGASEAPPPPPSTWARFHSSVAEIFRRLFSENLTSTLATLFFAVHFAIAGYLARIRNWHPIIFGLCASTFAALLVYFRIYILWTDTTYPPINFNSAVGYLLFVGLALAARFITTRHLMAGFWRFVALLQSRRPSPSH